VSKHQTASESAGEGHRRAQMTTKTFLLCATVALAGLVSANAQVDPCPPVSADSYALPAPYNSVIGPIPSFLHMNYANGVWGGASGGMLLQDLNGDGLPELIVSIGMSWESYASISCVYMNTGRGWALALPGSSADNNNSTTKV
jgi:hypothetical protein